jgi:acetoin:2,6-dichlorophenolindophenol oxidoreductase subunit alpha
VTSAADAARSERRYRDMTRIRMFEEAIADCAEAKEIIGPTHLYIGQEAVAVGACEPLRRDDIICGGHRSHGHYLAKGGDMRALAAEIFGRATGCSGGRGGSMHLVAMDIGLLGTSALVGGGMGVGVGAALADTLAGRDRVSVIFFGDGAVEEGVFTETLNFAALKKLPVVYVCENNLYASHMPISSRQPVGEIWRHAEPYGIPGLRIDGNDVAAVANTVTEAVARARRREGPTLIECMTYRWRGHVGPSLDLDRGLRTREELDEWIARCPIERLVHESGMSAADRARLDDEIRREVADAIEFARSSPYPDPATLLDHVYR